MGQGAGMEKARLDEGLLFNKIISIASAFALANGEISQHREDSSK